MKFHWSREENWILLWITKYVKKCPKNKLKIWSENFYKRCPNKTHFKPTRRHTQAYNIEKAEIFTEQEIINMEQEIQDALEHGEIANIDILPPQPLTDLIQQVNTEVREIVLIQAPEATKESYNISAGDLFDEADDESFEGFPNSDDTQEIELRIENKEINKSNLDDNTNNNLEQELFDMIAEIRRETTVQQVRNDQQLTNQFTDNEEANLYIDQILNQYFSYKERPISSRVRLPKVIITKKLKQKIKKVNEALKEIVSPNCSLTELNLLNYAAAIVAQGEQTNRSTTNNNKRKKGNFIPKWKRKQMEKLQQARKDSSIISEYVRGIRSAHLSRQVDRIRKDHRNEDIIDLDAIQLNLNNKIKAIGNSIRIYDEKFKSKVENKQFLENPQKFYRNMGKNQIQIRSPPDKQELERFWKNIYENPEQHNLETNWLEELREDFQPIPQMQDIDITEEEFKKQIASTSNFKSPGIDQVQNFWIKQFPALHKEYANALNRIMHNEEGPPEWLTEGVTYLLPKTQETQLPNKYRPITCLPTIYKMLTGIITEKISHHFEVYNLISEEQAGGRKNTYGVKEQLLLNKTILENCRNRQTNLHMAWIDYKKAYDSVPHSWIIECLKLYKVNPSIINFINEIIPNWKTSLKLYHEAGEITIPDVNIKRGIYQGDSLSPLLFIMAIDPLSKLINKSNTGYNLKRRSECKTIVNHLLYMDDLKLYAASESQLTKQLEIVKQFSDDIKMQFGLDKCGKLSLVKGKQSRSDGIQIDHDTFIRELERDENYKYLGILENEKIDHKEMRNTVTKEYYSRIRKVLKTSLTPKNKITAINQLAIPILQNTFGVITWPQNIINGIDVKTRKLLTINKLFYKNQDHNRLYLPRRKGGMGLINVNQSHRSTNITLAQYLTSSSRRKIKIIKEHEEEKPQNTSIIKLAYNFLQKFNLQVSTGEENQIMTATKVAQKTKNSYVKRIQKELEDNWGKSKRARFIKEELDQEYIDKEGSIEWLKTGAMKYDTERIILAAQDNALWTRATMHMTNPNIDKTCRMCHDKPETTVHLMSGCQTLLASGAYTARHNSICKLIHYRILEYFNIPRPPNFWKHEPPKITTNNQIDIYYDFPIPIARHIEGGHVKPDILVRNRTEKTAHIIEVGVTGDTSINTTEWRKIQKYQDLKNAIKSEWNLGRVELIPVVVGTTGLIKKSLSGYLERIPGRVTTGDVQYETIRGTSSILKRALGGGQDIINAP